MLASPRIVGMIADAEGLSLGAFECCAMTDRKRTACPMQAQVIGRNVEQDE
jgi:hypothetical protein